MSTFAEGDYEKMAKRVVDRFLSREAAFPDAAADEAKSNQLNPDQIERMTQAANTEAFLRMMDERKQQGAGDLMHEFEPVDSRQIIKIVIDQNGVHVDGPHDNQVPGAEGGDEVPQESMDAPPEAELPQEEPEEEEEPEDSNAPFPSPKKKGKKPASKDLPPVKEEPKTAALSSDTKRAVIAGMRKVASHMADARRQADYLFEDQFSKLQEHFRGIYKEAEFAEFQKSALVECGDKVGTAALEMLRTSLRMPSCNLNEKRAGLLDRHISSDTPQLRLFENLCKTIKQAARLDAGLKWIKERCDI